MVSQIYEMEMLVYQDANESVSETPSLIIIIIIFKLVGGLYPGALNSLQIRVYMNV